MQVPSVQLFVDRARAVRPDFRVLPGNAAAVAAVCERLEGFPLAIVLAAARAQVLTPAEILDHLEQRFDFLVNRQRDAASRHRTLRAALGWSYDLLAPELQRFFARLSVFRGGWTLAAAEAVCADDERRTTNDERPASEGTSDVGRWSLVVGREAALDSLTELRDCSMVLVEDQGEETRYRLLETLREFAREQLDAREQDALERRHMAYYLALAEQVEPELFGPQQARYFRLLETEYDNLRAVLAWSQAPGVDPGDTTRRCETGVTLAGSLWWFWLVRGYAREGRGWLEGALERSRPLGATPSHAKALHAAGGLAWIQGNLAVARPLEEASVAMWREVGDQRGLAFGLRALGWVATDQGDHAVGRAAVEESLRIYRTLGDRVGIGRSLNFLGQVAIAQGDLAAARELLQEGLGHIRAMNDEMILAWVLQVLGKVVLREGNLDEARSLAMESLQMRRTIEDRRGIAQSLEGLAEITFAQGEPERAARLFGAAAACREILGVPLLPHLDWRADQERLCAAMRSTLGEERFAAAWAEGHARAWDQADVELRAQETPSSTSPPIADDLQRPGSVPSTPAALRGPAPSVRVHPSPGPCFTGISDAQWEALRPLLPTSKKRGRPRADNRRTLEGVLYVLRTRCRWQDLPPRYGSPVTCWRRRAQWQADGTWQRLWTAFLETLQPRERETWIDAVDRPTPVEPSSEF